MAYAAIISLANTIDRSLNHNQIYFSPTEKQLILSILEYVNSFQAFLENFPDKSNSLEGRMRELAYEAEDIIEYLMLELVSLCSDRQTEEWIQQMEDVHEEICMIAELKEINDSSSSEDGELGADSAIVGFEDHVIGLKERLCGEPSKLQVIPICGMGFIGKTTLAKIVYDDPLIIENFVIRVWVTISQDYSAQRILSSLLECLKEFNTDGLEGSNDEKVHKILMGRRYLVVIDDIWSRKAWDVVRKVFPDDVNGSRIMLTTRLSYVASYPDPSSKLYRMSFLNTDQSWDLLKQKVFADEDCPSELEDIGKEIARNCKGWPPAILVIAEFLSLTRRNLSSWKVIEQAILEYLVLEKVSSSSDNESGCHPSGEHEVQLKKVIGEIALIAGEVKEIKDSFSRKDIQYGADSPTLSSSSTAPIHKDDMVGFEHYVKDLKERLCGEPSKKLQVISICGMGGSGKTTLAKNVYEDRLIVEHFEIRLWVTISQDFSAQRIFSSLLESLKDFEAGVSGHSDDEKVYKILVGRKYLVVMDDIWSSKAWDAVRKAFPANGEHGTRVLLTTRLLDVASYPDSVSKPCEMGLLNADQSWDLFKQKVFADEDCPSELQDIGKEIAGNCKGLPLAIVVIAGLVSTVGRNPTSWQEITENVKSAETAKYNQIEAILCLSYVQLPQYLRPCFLYMASFPEDSEIHVTRLVRLWIAESFVKCPNSTENLEKEAEKWLEDLVKRNLVLVTKRRSDGRIKSCRLHDLMRDLCIRKAHQGKFLLNLMDMYDEEEHSIERIDNERRVSVDSSSLSCLSCFSGSAIHTIICRPWWNRIVKLDFLEGVRLVRVLDAEAADVESPLPAQLFELFHLRYLAIRYSDTIPRALSKLQNLQTLIIRGEKRSKFRVGVTPVDLVLWCMSELRHVYFDGKICFNDPRETTPPLENLQTLSRIDLVGCTERILKKIPNVTKLKMKCSGYRDDQVKNLVHLHRLENLTLLGFRTDFMFTLPETLKKLTLSDLGIPWNKMTIIGSLPNLQVLKLKLRACSGSTWETTDGEFQRLEFLLISVSNVKEWITESSHFPRLKRLFIHYCQFHEIPSAIVEFPSLELIEICDSTIKESLMQSVREIQKEQEDLGNDVLQVRYLSRRGSHDVMLNHLLFR